MTNTSGLKSYKPGQSGNPAGRPKGAKNWSTIVKEMLNDENLADALLKNKPAWWNKLASGQKNMHSAIAAAMMAKAVSGDKQAAEWLRKTGYGDMLDVTSEGDKLELPAVYLPTRKEVDDANN